MNEELRKAIVKHALVNAFKHDGKADAGAVLAKILGEHQELKQKAKELVPEVRAIVQELNKLSPRSQRQKIEADFPEAYAELFEKKEEVKQFPPLEGAELGKVVTRFPPEP